MYADTQWASDADKTLSLSKKTTSDASTDTSTDTSSATVEAAKKSLSDTSSQKIPEPSLELKAETPAETPVEVPVKPDANDYESDEDQQTKEALVKIYKIYPVFNKFQLHPVDKNGRFMTKFIIKNGTTIYTTKSKKWAKVDAIDWDATYDSIRIIMETNPRFLQYVSDLRKAKSNVFPGYQTTEPLKVWESLIGKKRRLSDPLKNDDSNRSKQRLEDSFAVDSSTSPDDGTVGELTPNPYTPSSDEAEARHGIKSGIDADMDKNLTNADNDAKLILSEFFKELRKQKVKLAFEPNPVIDTTDGVKVQNGLYFSNPTQKRLFNVRYSDDKKATSANDLRDLMANIQS
ncbi:hypothetical protein PC110_g7967 [Phytophthora cactorum]|uniref:Uncharacterized protein n=1 Tax=Phytophthora cactorum TaxID=29920 RepID=A0A329SG32_9STRA|nr:hypothetical protein PC110_g7967 [Phytophthora cactorum]